jgi:glyoxylase I family protein
MAKEETNIFWGFEHTAIAARDSRGLADWYIRMFGLEIVYDDGKPSPTYLLRAPDNTVVEILPAASAESAIYDQKSPGLRHLALTVPDFDAAIDYLREHGIDRFFDSRQSEESRLIFFRDPEGNILHLMWRAQALGSSKK